jgi:uncharacterized protein YbcI
MPIETIDVSKSIAHPELSSSPVSRKSQKHQHFDLRTQGEIEADVCEVVRRYSLEYMGRGPRDIRAYLLGDLLLIRMSGVLTVAEQHLAAQSGEKGTLLVRQVRAQLVEAARNELEAMVRVSTGSDVLCMHHDISTVTGEEIIIFTLDEPPAIRVAKRK